MDHEQENVPGSARGWADIVAEKREMKIIDKLNAL